MKQILTLLFCVFAVAAGMAQNVDNGGFEDWTDYGNYKEPTGWKTNNAPTIAAGETVYDTTDAYAGDSAAVVQTIYSVPITQYIGGILTNGSTHNDSLGMNGPSINYRPESFTGHYKYDAAPGDTALVVLYMYRFDSTLNRDSLIATGNARLGASATYKQFGFQILNADEDENSLPIPDSYVILILSTDSLSSPQASKLTIDELSFEGSVSAPTLLDATDINIYPNPVEDHFVVSSPSYRVMGVSVLSAEGRQVQYAQAPSGSNDLMVRTDRLTKGFYYVQIQFENGAVETRFITVVK